MNEFIKALDLEYSYPVDEGRELVSTLKGINLNIEQGSFVALLGHNGSGKSTLAKHFNAILQPTGGKMLVLGMDTGDEEQVIEIRRNVGMVFQNPDNQLVSNVVEEDVAFGPENLGIESAEILERVEDALNMVDMNHLRTHAPHLLSGGQKQRIAIAGIIAMRPRCIVLDEPTAMLDPNGRREVMETINVLNKKYGITVILITHHMSEAVEADRVIVLDDGHIFMDGTPKEVFARVDELKSIGLTVPDTVELVCRLNERGFNLPLSALTPAECAAAIAAALKGEV
ncbi:MAG: energy-coupling factor transporter ATPase [Oscillospiraceae bacterium]|nr:energy-coupling factor transporter ATPase [Oscillospiraceae bacterium]